MVEWSEEKWQILGVGMKRIYEEVIADHFRENRQMLFLMGPRQVGKTTLSFNLREDQERIIYYTWDSVAQREAILDGPDRIAEENELNRLTQQCPLLIFDEIHKFGNWKIFLKGLYDAYPSLAHILVMGSARLDVYQRGGDSLMGRYFPYRIHPLTVGELAMPIVSEECLKQMPRDIGEEAFKDLIQFGGFPDPFLKASSRFYQQWKRLRLQQLFEEEVRDLTRVQDVDRLEVLAEVVRRQIGQQTSYASLSKKLRVTDKTIRDWIALLRSVYYCFEVRPWSKNVAHAILKEPKYYLWDWAQCEEEGQRAENMVASHLLKAVHFWNDYGLGEFGLYYVRDKQQREVDFLVVKNDKPWILVEVKNGSKRLTSSLFHFAQQLNPDYVFQVAFDMPYVDKNSFISAQPLVVSARSFLSQLI